MNYKKNFLPFLICAVLLQGCVAAFIAGAAVGGVIVYDQRTFEMMGYDNDIDEYISKRIDTDPAFRDSHIIVSSFNRRVLLVGQTPHASLRATAMRIAKKAPRVRKIYNQIEIAHPSSTLSRANDTLINTKIRAQMLTKKGLKSGNIKIVTEAGSVYLMGEVSREQAKMAVKIARETSGVRRVVKAFHYTR